MEDALARPKTQAAATLVGVARKYLERGLPLCAVDLYRGAAMCDSTIDAELLQAEQRTHTRGESEAKEDVDLFFELQSVFHPWRGRMLPIRRPKQPEAIAAADPNFIEHAAARRAAAARLVTMASKYAGADRPRVAFAVLAEAFRVDSGASIAATRKLLVDYREKVARDASKQRDTFMRDSSRRGTWKKSGKAGVLPPAFDSGPALALAKTKLVPPYRVQVDVTLEQQPGGGGIVVAARDAKNYVAVELNTIGYGISVYVARVVDGKRSVIGGSAILGTDTKPAAVKIDAHAWR